MSLAWGVPQPCRVTVSNYLSIAWLSQFLLRWWRDWLPWPFNQKSRIDSLVKDCENRYMPIPGVEIEVDSPGKTHGFDYLDYVEGIGIYGTKYFHDLITMLNLAGYIEGDTLIGFPYDWRYPLWQFDFNGLKELIEDFLMKHPDKKITIIAHSLG